MGTRVQYDEKWTTTPSTIVPANQCDLIKARAGQPTKVVFLIPMALGRFVHWNGERTVPCPERGCDLCATKTRREWKMWAGVWLPASGRVAMLELPESALTDFQSHYMKHQTAYGWMAHIVRVGKNDRSKVRVYFQHKWNHSQPLPEAPHPVDYMNKVWQVFDVDPTPATQRGSNSHPSTPGDPRNIGRLPIGVQ